MYPFGSGVPHGGAPYNPPQNNSSSVPFGAGRWAPPSQNPPPSSYLPNQHNYSPSAPFGAGRWIEPNQSPYPSSQPAYPPSQPAQPAYPSSQPPYPSSNPYQPQPQYSSHPPSQAPYPSGNAYQPPSNSPYPPYPAAQPQQQQQSCPYPPSSTTPSYAKRSSGSYDASQHGFSYLPQNSNSYSAPQQTSKTSTYHTSQSSTYPSHQTSPYPSQSSPYPSHQTSTYPQPGSPYKTATYSVAQTGSYAQGQGARATIPRKGTPTVFPAADFDPVKDAHALRKAMRGFGTDEDALINIICRRTNAQRQEIARQYKTHFGKDLIENIISETSGNFQKVLVGLLMPIVDYYVKELNDAMAGLGTDEDVLIEVMCTLSNYEIHTIKDAYRRTYGRDLESELISETSGNFKRLMVALCAGARNESGVVDQAAALNDARELLNAGELRFGTDESTFNAVLCQRNFQQLKLVFQEYQNLTGHSLEKAIKREFSGDIQEGLLAIYKCVMDKAEFFASRLHKSMAGIGTNDQQLIRIIITRCEIDMQDIKAAYERLYGKTLRSWIKGDTSGDYKHALYVLIGEERSS